MGYCESWHHGTCWATKECEECSYDGDKSKCNFYLEKRKRNKCTYFSNGMCESNYIFSKNCSCNGDKSQCNFYEIFRKENKTMNTAEMWIKAQKDGCCYRTFDLFNGAIFYQKDKGLFNEDGEYCPSDYFGLFDNLMDQDWEIHGGFLTKSEAEAKFNIKIVD